MENAQKDKVHYSGRAWVKEISRESSEGANFSVFKPVLRYKNQEGKYVDGAFFTRGQLLRLKEAIDKALAATEERSN